MLCRYHEMNVLNPSSAITAVRIWNICQNVVLCETFAVIALWTVHSDPNIDTDNISLIHGYVNDKLHDRPFTNSEEKTYNSGFVVVFTNISEYQLCYHSFSRIESCFCKFVKIIQD